MEDSKTLLEKLKAYGIGRRKLDDEFFSKDKPLLRLGIFDEDDKSLCHEVIKSSCHIPGCRFTSDSLLDFENHYNSSHRYSCSQCKKVLPSPHLLDLHIQETHDSFFAVLATKKPSYCCFIEECKDMFLNAENRLDHCVKVHKLPKDFRFDQNSKQTKVIKKKPDKNINKMEVVKERKFEFSNSKQKAFEKYTGRTFTMDNDVEKTCGDINMEDLKSDLPE